MTDTFQRIAPEQARELLAQGAQLVDIRDAQSFANGHIPGAHHLDNQWLHAFIAQADFDQPLIVNCYHGMSSQGAAAFLAQQGFSQVYSLEGGFERWRLMYPQELSRDFG